MEYGRGSRLLSSTGKVQGVGKVQGTVGTGTGTAPAQISASSSPLMSAHCRNQRKATKLDMHRPLAACQTYRQRGNSECLPLAAAVVGELVRLWKIRVQRRVLRLATVAKGTATLPS